MAKLDGADQSVLPEVETQPQPTLTHINGIRSYDENKE